MDGVGARRRLTVAFFLPCGRWELLGPASELPKLVPASWVATSSEASSDRATDLDRLLEELEEDVTTPPLYFGCWRTEVLERFQLQALVGRQGGIDDVKLALADPRRPLFLLVIPLKLTNCLVGSVDAIAHCNNPSFLALVLEYKKKWTKRQLEIK